MKIKFLIIISLLSIVLLSNNVSASWFNLDQSNRVINQIPDGVRPYQLRLFLHNSSGVNTATDVYLNGLANPGWTGLNFTIGGVDIPFYIMDNGTGEVWLNLTGNGTVELYYGNNTGKYLQPYDGLGRNTSYYVFPFYDNFTTLNASKWTSVGASVSGGEASIATTGVGYGNYMYTNVAFDRNSTTSYNASWQMAVNGNTLNNHEVCAAFSKTTINCADTTVGWFFWAGTGMYKVDDGIMTLVWSGTPGTGAQRNYNVRMNKTNGSVLWTDFTTPSYVTLVGSNSNLRFKINPYLGGASKIDNVMIRSYHPVEPTFVTWNQTTWSNNKTFDNSTAFNVITGTTVNFNITADNSTDVIYYEWSVNGTNQSWNYRQFNYTFNTVGIVTINGIANVSNKNMSVTWNTTALTYSLELINPSNGSTGISINPTLSWRQWTTTLPHTYQISTDSQFINIISSGSVTSSNENFSVSANLDAGTTYYWRVKNSTMSGYSDWFNFTTAGITHADGRLNITVFDEKNWNGRIMTFSAQIYNSTKMLNKSTTTGWVNFSESEVSDSEYLIQIIPNSSYASRNVLATSPANVTLWLPNTTNTIDTIAFYLLDYTTLYPWTSSNLSITKNGSTMHSSYFDADSKVAAYLIRGDSYGITIRNGNNINNWGNYISTASGNVQIVITNIAVNATSTIPFNYNLSITSSDITLSWLSNVTINNLTYSILKNDTTQVHLLTTMITHGSSLYTITDLNSTYYIYITANTTVGTYTQKEIFNPRGGSPRTDCGLGLGCRWNYGTFTMPQWVYDIASMIAIWVVAGSFGFLFAPLGAIAAVVMMALLMWWGWLSNVPISVAGTIGVLVIADYLRHKEKEG